MKKSFNEFKDYIYKISNEMNGNKVNDTYWIQSLVPENIKTENEAIEYLYNHQDLVKDYIQSKKEKDPFDLKNIEDVLDKFKEHDMSRF